MEPFGVDLPLHSRRSVDFVVDGLSVALQHQADVAGRDPGAPG
jgi:hypothetical protein